MLYLMAAALAQTAAPTARATRLVDCKPMLALASATSRPQQQRREEAPPKRPKPCPIMASA